MRRGKGFTLIELLIVVAIIAILILIALTTLPKQLAKARDGERKSDLNKIKISFENYYNDNGCYPSATVLENCGGVSPASHELSPYLQNIPCDPLDESYYLYAPYDKTGGSGTCDGFRVWANLEKDDDPVVEVLNCDGASACGAYGLFGDDLGALATEYNYGVSEGVSVLNGDSETVLESGSCCSGNSNDVCNNWDLGQGACNIGPYFNYDECMDLTVCGDDL